MIDPQLPAPASQAGNVVDIDLLATVLDKLEREDSFHAEIVKMRVVWGMTVAEVRATANGGVPGSDRTV